MKTFFWNKETTNRTPDSRNLGFRGNAYTNIDFYFAYVTLDVWRVSHHISRDICPFQPSGALAQGTGRFREKGFDWLNF